jgi:hypothetical protein
VDLSPGDLLTFIAEPGSGSDVSCNPAGAESISAAADKLPLPSALAGTVIAKASQTSVPTAIGKSGGIFTDRDGHLFIGVNQVSPSACAFRVEVQIEHNGDANTKAAARKAVATEQQEAKQPAPQENAGSQSAATTQANSSAAQPAQKPSMKEQLSSAAKVWVQGQFGKASTGNSSESEGAVSSNAAASTAAASSSGLKAPTVILDADLRKHIDALPRRVDDHMGNLGDMVNFVIVGSEEHVKAALEAAEWHLADVDNKEAGLKAVLTTYQKKDYLGMPMSHLYLFDRMQDFGYEQAQAFSVVASRHHFRMWKAPFEWNGETVYVGAGTHDIGFEKDVRTGHLTHKIDPDVDKERENIAESLDKAGKVKSSTYYLPPSPVQEAKNASGGGYRSDGRLVVVFVK